MKPKRSFLFKSLAVFLVFVMVMQMLPMFVFANTNNHKLSQAKIDSIITEYTENNKSNDKIVAEITDKRDEYSKTYLLEDGSYYCITSSYPVHYLNGDKWSNVNGKLNEIPETINNAEKLITESSLESYANMPSSLLSSAPSSISNNSMKSDAIGFNNIGVNSYSGTITLSNDAHIFIKPNTVFNYSANNLLITNVCLQFVTSAYPNQAVDVYAYEEIYNWEDDISSYSNNNNLELLDSQKITNSGEEICNINITDAFSKWERENLDNHGVDLKFVPTRRTTLNVSNFCISIQYKDLSNDNTNNTYHTVDLGKAGTLTINDITNTLTVNQQMIGINSNILPINITRTISSVLPSLNANGNVSGNWNYGYALELKDNIMTWTMPDGCNVKFQNIDNEIINGYQRWKQITDNVSLSSTLFVDNNAVFDEYNMDYSKCYIETNDSNIYCFDVNGRLSFVEKNNNKINISYGSRGISQITDANGNKYKFTYSQYTVDGISCYYVSKIAVFNESGEIVKVSEEDFDVNISVEYDANSETITNQETFCDGSTVKYIFNKSGNLQKIECPDGSFVELTYKDEINNYLVSYEHFILEDGEKIILESLRIFSDNTYYRMFTDKDNNTEEFSYNYDFQLVTYKDGKDSITCMSYDENGNISSYAFRESTISLLNNNEFEYNPLGDAEHQQTWYTDNESFVNYENKSIELFPSSSSVILYQEVNDYSSLTEGTTIVFGAEAMVDNTYPCINNDMYAGIIIYVCYTDGSEEEYLLPLDASLDNDVQIRLMAFSLKADCEYIDYSLYVKNQKGTVTFYKADFFIAEESSADPFGIKTSSVYNTAYNENGRLARESISNNNETNPLSLIQTYQYDDENNINSVTNYDGTTTYYKYDSATNKLIQSGNAVDINGNIINPTTYAYNASGLVESITSTVTAISDVGNSTSTNSLSSLYTYDESERITSVTNNGTKYSFDYLSNGNINSVSVSGINNSGETVNQILQQYNYNTDSNVNRIDYGNGSFVIFVYNEDDVINNIEYYESGSTFPSSKFIYSYNDNNEIEYVLFETRDTVLNNSINTKHKIVYTDSGYELYDCIQNETGETYRLIYCCDDSANSKCETFLNKGTDDSGIVENTMTVHSSNSINGNKNYIDSFNMEKYVLFSDTLPVEYSLETTTNKDSFGRVNSKSIEANFVNLSDPTNTANFNYSTNYSYQTLDSENSQTSSLISEYSIEGDFSESTYLPDVLYSTVYKYDSRGNLQFKYYKFYDDCDNCSCGNNCSCSDNNKCSENCNCNNRNIGYVLGQYYGYDEQNQLVCEANPINDIYATYTYDTGGNLIKKTLYSEVPNFTVSDNQNFNVYSLLEMDENTFNSFDFSQLENSLLLMSANKYYEYIYTYDTTFTDRMIKYTEKEYKTNSEGLYSQVILEQTINYDSCGNPLNYIGYNYEGLIKANLKWNGNLLTEFALLDDEGNTSKIFTYEYDQNGYRTSKKKYIKSSAGDTFDLFCEQNYVWDNGVLQGVIFKGRIYDYLTENNSYDENLVTYSKIIYDSDGSPIGYITPTGFMYYYIKDVQGNVIGLKITTADSDDSSSIYVEMHYDSWGQLSLLNAPQPSKIGYNSYMLTALFNPCTYKGYLYDYESGMYYSKSECYSPTWGRNISTDGDYTKLQKVSNNVLDNNPYIFCNNNLISNQDTYASWSTIKNDFNWFEDGFSVGMSKAFLSRPFCTLYAAQLIKENGNWNYQYGSNLYNMGVERISTNLFARALGHYAPNAINKVNANWGLGWLTGDTSSDTLIYIKNNEKDYIINNYKWIWKAAPSIKNYAWSSGVFITI